MARSVEELVPPPRHPRCRCTLVPITKSWKELGVDAEEVPDSTRASFDGQVPATETYPDWLKRMEEEEPGFALDVLGPKRYGWWKAGKIEFKEMVRGNKILTVEQLKKLLSKE